MKVEDWVRPSMPSEGSKMEWICLVHHGDGVTARQAFAVITRDELDRVGPSGLSLLASEKIEMAKKYIMKDIELHPDRRVAV